MAPSLHQRLDAGPPWHCNGDRALAGVPRRQLGSPRRQRGSARSPVLDHALTNPVLDPFGKIPEFKFCAVRVTAGGEAATEFGYAPA